MSDDQAAILLIIGATVVIFVWGRWRHDMTALAALLGCVLTGLVPAGTAFTGFGHPAVITVACVLVLSRGLQATGAVDALADRVLPATAGPLAGIAALTALGAALSSFMNNVGAMALLMPVAVQMAGKQGLPPGKVLMPLAFGSILGGMTTLIGTPPNMIVSGFRATVAEDSFGMFDFTPAGLSVATAGVLFVILVGWRLVPRREHKGAAGFDTGSYITEALVDKKSKSVGKTLREVERQLDEADAQVLAMVRNDLRLPAPNRARRLRAGDILVIEAEPQSLAAVLSSVGLRLGEHGAGEESTAAADRGASGDDVAAPQAEPEARDKEAEETVLRELAVMPASSLIGRSADGVGLRAVYGINLLALSRQGQRTIRRLRGTSIRGGDLLLLQGAAEALDRFAADFGCVPLAERLIRIPDKRRALLASMVMAAAVGGAAFGLLPAAISFAAGVLLYMSLRVIPLSEVYSAIDWPVIVLLAALMPVAAAMGETGTADLIARWLLAVVADGRPVLALALILVVTMTLSDFMNNAATAAVMCPIAISAATQLGANPDAFLMAVAVGASCAFLTPIGHQNNTLILGPGGFRFGDYWRLGLPVELVVVAVGVPMLLLVWPL